MVRFTRDAHAELTRRISSTERDPYVYVAWSRAQVDLVRSRDGTAEWKETSPAQWTVSVQAVRDEAFDPIADEPGIQEHRKWLDEHLTLVDGLRVYFEPGSTGYMDVLVAYSDGQFHVHKDDA